MKFTCSQASLSKAINTVSKAVSVRTTIPILKGILLNVKNERLTLSASDLDISIETSIDVQNSEDGNAVVSAKLLGEIIRKLPNTLVSAEIDEENKFNINCIGSNFSIVSLPAEEFPIIKGIDSKDFIDIKKENFINLIKKTSFAASIDEKKGILKGSLLSFEKDSLEMVALDGFRMAVAKDQIDTGLSKKIVVPARILNEIQKILLEEDGDTLSLLFDEKKIEVRTEETVVISRLLEGEFIKYKDIIPSSYKTRMVVSRLDMLSSIERASLLAKEGKNNLIKIVLSGKDVNITSRSDEGNVNEHISAEIEGEDLTIGFNSKYLIDVLKAVDDEEIVFEMGTSVSACIIKSVEAERYTYLVLPVRITAA